jgi:hypothetical protein
MTSTTNAGPLTFDQIIALMNQRLPDARYHIWQEYSDGKTGYSTSRKTLAHARSVARKLPGATIYDRNGEDVE